MTTSKRDIQKQGNLKGACSSSTVHGCGFFATSDADSDGDDYRSFVSTGTLTAITSTSFFWVLLVVLSWPGLVVQVSGAESPSTSSRNPSPAPSSLPTLTAYPTAWAPTPEPSLLETQVASQNFRQLFGTGNGNLFTKYELKSLEMLYATYTVNFVNISDVGEKTVTECHVNAQVLITTEVPTSVTASPAENNDLSPYGNTGRNLLRQGISRQGWYTNTLRMLQGADPATTTTPSSFAPTATPLQQLVQVDYEMKYTSNVYNVSNFTLGFQMYVNSKLPKVAQQLSLLGINVTSVALAKRIVFQDPTSPSNLTEYPTPTVTPSTIMEPLGPTTSPPSGTVSPSSLVTSQNMTENNGPWTVASTSPPASTPGKLSVVIFLSWLWLW